MDNAEKYRMLREKHKEFIYHGFDIADDGIFFHFSIDGYDFYPSWKTESKLLEKKTPFLENIVFNIGMAELVSYWKCACSPVVRVLCGSLTEEQCLWWKKLYFNGLGEFFYRNGIDADFDSFMQIIPDNSDMPLCKCDKTVDGYLVPVGGGKDSVVTLELLRQYHDETMCYIINKGGAAVACAKTAGFDDNCIVGPRRTIDRALIERNADGYLNGHTPFSAVVAFSAYLYAYIYGKKYIVLSNESSANETYVSGKQINHQYSKSTEFERDFREYVSRYLDDSIQYFSLLRPWSEWQIAKKFVTYPKYFPVFLSCNLGSKTDKWCADCAKCLYVYILLAAFLDDETLVKIFGKNMLDCEKYADMFDGLVLDGTDKPFECVGTKSEVRLSLYMAAELRSGKQLPLLLRRYTDTEPSKPVSLENYFDTDNFVPQHLIGLLK